MENKAGHHGVQVDHRQSFPTRSIDENIVDLRVVVRDPLREFAAGCQIQEYREKSTSALDEAYFLPD